MPKASAVQARLVVFIFSPLMEDEKMGTAVGNVEEDQMTDLVRVKGVV